MNGVNTGNLWKDKKVVVVGAARQGTALVKYLKNKGAYVILNDQRSGSELKNSIELLKDLSIEWVLGNHPIDILDDTDLLCLSGGVPLSLPLVVEARHRGIKLSNDSQIFMEDTQSKNIIGITGSAGKTTTTSLVGEIIKLSLAGDEKQSSNHQKVWVGGNIGNPLISYIDQIRCDDLVVIELSSFQLEIMSTSPRIAAVLNISPNHLDRHGTMQEYTTAKAQILTNQVEDATAILNRDDQGSWGLISKVNGKLVTFGMKRSREYPGVYIEEDDLNYLDGYKDISILPIDEISLRGEHNLYNVLAACAITISVGVPISAIRQGIVSFKGLAHRLEHIRKWGGADWYNDSIATAPERVIAAIKSFEEPLILLAGGRDKDLPWDELIELMIKRLRYLILFGESAENIEKIIDAKPNNQTLPRVRCQNLYDAVKITSKIVQEGDLVLFSPGGTSFDEFRDFEERGLCFRKWVMEL